MELTKLGANSSAKTIPTAMKPRDPRTGIHGLIEIKEEPSGIDINSEISTAAYN